MSGDYTIYDELYKQARQNGWSGWGGNRRIASGPEQVKRIFRESFVPRHGRALELGCGEGHLCRLLSREGFQVTGVDVSKVAIDWAKEKQAGDSIRYIQANLCHAGVLEDEVFDLVVDGNCLHCILGEDRAAFLNNVFRLISSEGIFFVSSLCVSDGKSVIIERDGQPYRFVPSVEHLLRELNRAHLRVLQCEVRERDEFNHINVFAQPRMA